MGSCGTSQPGAGEHPLGNHGLCPYYYNLAFENDFLENNFHQCRSSRIASYITTAVKMGYLGNFDRWSDQLLKIKIYLMNFLSDPWLSEISSLPLRNILLTFLRTVLKRLIINLQVWFNIVSWWWFENILVGFKQNFIREIK